MVVNPSNAISVYTANREQRLQTTPSQNENVKGDIQEAGRTSEASPAVVVEVSASVLETSRAVHAASQTADQDLSSLSPQRPEQPDGKESSRQEESRGQSVKKRNIDVTA